ncbi:MAG: ATP-binding cassette domain-containing protein [Holosporaceae bacterium]|jgi:subfamily B ATP-binding cassette protein MsbA|nr:ATP-binding cassette domain-containing protein [Holosporaceae bacterium]
MFKRLKQRITSSYIFKNYKDIYPYIKPYRLRALLAILVTFPVGTMDALIAWSLRPYMNVVMIEKDLSISSYIPLLIIVFSILQSGFNYSATYLSAWVGAKISNGLKYDLFKKMISLETSFFDKTTSGNIQLRFNSDVDMACSGLLNNIKLFTTRVFSSVSLICVLLMNSWKLAIVAVVVLVAALYPLSAIRKRISSIVSEAVFTSASIMTCYIEAFSGNRLITSYNLYANQLKKISDILANVFALGIKMIQRTGILSPMMHFVISVGIAIIIWMGSYLIVYDGLTPGAFVSFITALLLLYQPIKSIGNDFSAMEGSLLAMERVFSLLKTSPAIRNAPSAVKINHIQHNITYQNVCFEYEKGKPVLANINLTIDVGKTVALVGNSGGGKTTLANLLPRFYDVTSGHILLDGIDVRDINLYSLRNIIGVVFQDNFLFSGTIRENILLGKTRVTENELAGAIKSACLDEFIASLRLGWDTEIGERGVLLSGGQKQRVAIARAFLKDAPVVILDEATSALDNKSEAIVQEAIGNLMKDRTVIIIAHRLSTVRNADKIVVINNGEIIEMGTHQELVDKDNSAYAALYHTQLM